MAIGESSDTQIITKHSRSKTSHRISVGYFFIGPALIILVITSVYPVVYSLVLSTFDWKWGTDMDFVGLRNYTRLLTSSSFWQILGHTLYFTVGAVTVEMTLGLGLAVVVNRLGFGVGVIRTLLLTPLMVSGIIVSLMWKILLDPTLGIVNYLFRQLGLPTLAWLGATNTAMPSIILIDSWWQTAFVFIVLSAGLQSLPREPFEAAEVDGASGWQSFRYLTLPMLRPVLLTVLIFRTIDTLKVFDIIFGTTGGGPAQSTEVVQTLAYRTAFDFLQLSRSMTIMVIFSIIILAISLVYLRMGDGSDD
ncbi:MAG: sugar ABC transporter permease [Anaerolineae bacterium]|jgi:multiple sugar transport system permease protein|nr:sugar ABC transporter permease [Anaerolineae bacterium]